MLHDGGWATWLLLGWLALCIGAMLGTVRLVVRVWKLRRNVKPISKGLAMAVAAAAVWGGGGTLFGLAKAFGAVGSEIVDPSQKARVLAEGISEAMNCTAFGLLVGLPSLSVLLIIGMTPRRGAP